MGSSSPFVLLIVQQLTCDSNGIRFSITNMAPETSRIIPTLYQDRAGISLYDAQWSTGQKQPLPESIITDVVRTLQRFKNTCRDFGVSDSNVRIIATEATRQAINSEDFRAQIKNATGWTVEMLPKEEEGRIGAMGVVSSFASVRGLMMDLGGGSTQITWLISNDGHVQMSEQGSVSMPYGAAALSRRLTEANKLGGNALNELRDEITTNLKDAVSKISLPEAIHEDLRSPQGLSLYLSGGGFRGWGFVLMSQHPVSPYPIPIINGFKTTVNAFNDTNLVMTAANEENIFRVSERRASQVPAVALLVSCLSQALPSVSTVYFAQGGVREGSLFINLDEKTKAQNPLMTATVPYAAKSTTALEALIKAADPAPGRSVTTPPLITNHILVALAQGLYIHNSNNKDLQAAAALRSTTTGVLGAVHGASHDERAGLAIMLCERWGGVGALSPADEAFYDQLLELLGPEEAWWCMYYGRIAAVVGEIYPAGIIREGEELLKIKVEWADPESTVITPLAKGELKLKPKEEKEGKKDKKDKKDKKPKDPKNNTSAIVKILFDFGTDDESILFAEGLEGALKRVEKLGKKKSWPGEWGGHAIDLSIKSAFGSKIPEGYVGGPFP
jgi:retrograde regulation protein 2